MRAVRFHEYGGTDVLRYEDVSDPVAGDGEVVVRVEACSIQHSDLDMRSGVSRFPLALPHTLGMEFSGSVIGVGPEVHAFRPGDRVVPLYQVTCGLCRHCLSGDQSLCDEARIPGVHFAGGYAEYAKIDARGLVHIPDDVSYEVAAAKNSLTTAWHALVARAELQAGESVLVNAAGSGVGSAAVQIARLLGATVIASAGSAEKLQRALQEGADYVVDYESGDLGAQVRELTGGRGVDVVFECVGGDVFQSSLTALAKKGRIVAVGAHAGESVTVDLVALFRNQWTLSGSLRASPAELLQVLELLRRGRLRTVVGHVLPLEAAGEGHRLLEARSAYGKVLLRP